MFYDNFIKLCAAAGKSPSAVALENGLTKSNVTYWKKGRNMPSNVTLAKLADYFGCTVEDLTAEKEKPALDSGPNKEMLLRWIDEMSREQLIETLQAVTKKLSEDK